MRTKIEKGIDYKTWADLVRQMNISDAIDITEKGRASAINQAKVAFPSAKFVTRFDVDKSKVYLIRVA